MKETKNKEQKTVKHREPYSISCNIVEKNLKKNIYIPIHLYISESLHCTPEMNTVL